MKSFLNVEDSFSSPNMMVINLLSLKRGLSGERYGKWKSASTLARTLQSTDIDGKHSSLGAKNASP